MFTRQGAGFMAVLIVNGITQVNQFRTNANMFQGKGVANGWTMNAKSNFGIGQVAGNFNSFITGTIITNDPDLVDTPIADAKVQGFIGPEIMEVT